MKKIMKIGKLFFVVTLTIMFYSCSNEEALNNSNETSKKTFLEQNDSHLKFNVFKGPQVALGEGKVRSWVSIRKDGFPLEIGVEFTARAFENLSSEANDHATIVVPLHQKARAATPFDHIGLNWNPEGHPPPGVFSPPHFDVHFYMISQAERMAIPAWSPSSDAAFNNYPPTGYMPDSYFTPPGADTAEAEMGKHWLPVNLGDFLPFSKIMILGSYDGKFSFVEPMVTLDYLLSNEEMSFAYPQPQYFAVNGNYPTKYNIYRDSKKGHVFITLSDFVARN
jgi:hypothetical protein